MSDIWIFGDSWGADWNSDDTWHYYLQQYKQEKQKNFAQSGIGTFSVMNKLYEKYENNEITENDKIILFISDPYRINFKFLESETDSVFVSQYLRENVIEKKYLEEYKKYIQHFFSAMKNELTITHIKNILFLKNISKNKNLKTIIINCFNSPQNKKLYKIYDIEKLNDENFLVYNDFIHEFPRKYDDNGEIIKNHMSKWNHKIFSKLLMNFFYNTNFDIQFETYKSESKYKYTYD